MRCFQVNYTIFKLMRLIKDLVRVIESIYRFIYLEREHVYCYKKVFIALLTNCLTPSDRSLMIIPKILRKVNENI